MPGTWFAWRRPEGFKCPRCAGTKYSEIQGRQLLQCRRCRYQTSLIAGTVLQGTKLLMRVWFHGIAIALSSFPTWRPAISPEVRGPKPYRQRQFRAVHHRAGRDRGLTTAGEAFVGVRPAPQQRRAPAAANLAHEAFRPALPNQECRATHLVRETRLEFAQTARSRHCRPPSRPSRPKDPRGHDTTY